MSSTPSDLAVVAVLPPVVTVLVGVAVSLALRHTVPPVAADHLVIWISMGLAMVALPLAFLARDGSRPRAVDVGLVRPSWASMAVMTVLTIAIGGYQLLQGASLPSLLAQNVPVAFCEEFWCKGVIFHVCRDMISRPWVIVAASALAFAFVTHAGSPLLTNLAFRLPFSLVTALIYLRTRSLAWPVLLHLNYNLLVS